MNLRHVIDAVRKSMLRPFSRKVETVQAPKETSFHSLVEERVTSFDSISDWCRSFNKRNGYVVPTRSPESIARRALRLRKSNACMKRRATR
jgi:hypothetical protein